jgi:hypothetical protein
MEQTAPKNPLNITQAFNYLKDVKTKIAGIIKRKAKDAEISVAMPQDRAKFLAYGISLLDKVDEQNADLFFVVTGKSRHLYSRTELAGMFKQILVLRIKGYPVAFVAKYLHTPVDVMEKVEQIALKACSYAIEKANTCKMPLIGGLN